MLATVEEFSQIIEKITKNFVDEQNLYKCLRKSHKTMKNSLILFHNNKKMTENTQPLKYAAIYYKKLRKTRKLYIYRNKISAFLL